MLELLRKRRSIRKYQGRQLSRPEIEQLLKAALMSPSSRGLKPWEFIIVSHPDMLRQLSLSKTHGSSFLQGATAGIVVLADPNKCDVWIEDASIASVILHLTAASMNLGSCWIQIRKRYHDDKQAAEEYIKRLLSIPDHYQVESIIAIGYPAENKAPFKDSDLPLGKVHAETFGTAYFK
ncbi:MAG: nitroreductase family protein [Syntrophomonadaceae bacterium]|nr:nitroreductase family protein [Syntrophomonadaceae bacterium]